MYFFCYIILGDEMTHQSKTGKSPGSLNTYERNHIFLTQKDWWRFEHRSPETNISYHASLGINIK